MLRTAKKNPIFFKCLEPRGADSYCISFKDLLYKIRKRRNSGLPLRFSVLFYKAHSDFSGIIWHSSDPSFLQTLLSIQKCG